MGVVLTPMVNGTAISATDLRARNSTIEAFINHGIAQSDLTNSKWCDSQHWLKPDFSRFPSQVHAVSADTHYRLASHDKFERSVHHNTLASDAWVPVRGMAAPYKVPDSTFDGLTVYGTYYAFSAGADYPGGGFDQFQVADFGLFIDGDTAPIAGTFRTIYADGYGDYSERHQHSFKIAVTGGSDINPGVHQIGMKVRVRAPPPISTHVKHVWVDGRSFIVDVHAR